MAHKVTNRKAQSLQTNSLLPVMGAHVLRQKKDGSLGHTGNANILSVHNGEGAIEYRSRKVAKSVLHSIR